MSMAADRRATAIGLSAIALWSTLALFTAATGTVPPFLLAALTFAIGGFVGIAFILATGGSFATLLQPWPAWLHGVGGLFGYHALYFSALKLAPPAEASLIAYLWPLLIVLVAALLPDGRLRAGHLVGVLFGLGALLVLASGKLDLSPAYLAGYAAALACAVLWALYSVSARLLAKVPTEAVTGFCLATAALSALCHLAFEEPHWPAGATEWAAIVALGAGPVGAAFFAWDRGMKRGDVQLLGIMSYAAPVVSTLLLVLTGFAQPDWRLAAACLLIVCGALIGSRASRRQGEMPPEPP